MIYVASPYTHKDPFVMEDRFEKTCEYCALWINRGLVVYSPIVHNHPIAIRHTLPRPFDFWQKFDLHMLDMAESMDVLCIDGWEESKGVQAEIKYARDKQMPVMFRDINGVDIYKAKKEPKTSRRKKR